MPTPVHASRSPVEQPSAPKPLVIKRLGSTWSQADLGDAIDLSALSTIADMDSSGTNDLVVDILTTLRRTLTQMLERLEHHRLAGSAAGVRFEAHRIKSSASQLGAFLLADAAEAVLNAIPPATKAEAAAFRALAQRRALGEGVQWGLPSAVGVDVDVTCASPPPVFPAEAPFEGLIPLVDRLVREIRRVQIRLGSLLTAVPA